MVTTLSHDSSAIVLAGSAMANTEDVDPQECLKTLANEDAEVLKQRVIARLETVLSEKYFDREGFAVIWKFLSE
ncbi:hypothetical protein FEM03_07250 [Phragmitibacter flavus]|uniref:Uncharacterized protein n=1 Tax=Phragmitibacter flavus TaxID=2576071 RepID=A0A5R8KI76_9BACT|nr:hypothetical protein [Phragmitibacter flavus]TLD71319.1 hypothetical protein FEM03_07250 [Phragmitibacter flavus]